MLGVALDCLRDLAADSRVNTANVAGIGITGQQHGSVVVNDQLEPLTPFINWQDQRGRELSPDGKSTWIDLARYRLGDETPRRTGCRLNSGFLGLNAFWLAQNGALPNDGVACFLPELFAARLTETRPVTEPTCAGGAGLFNVADRVWDEDAIRALDLPRKNFVEVQEATTPVGSITPAMSERCGLPVGQPVMTPIGDH